MDGRLEAQFLGAGFKRLSAVDCIAEGVSNQHELNASSAMRAFLGESRKQYECRYVRLEDPGETGPVLDEVSTITYYNSREGKPRAAEYRLTYPASSEVMAQARTGDYCWVLRPTDRPDALLVVVAQGDTAVARQLDRLLGSDLRHEAGGVDTGTLRLVDLDESGDSDLTLDDADLLAALGVTVSLGHTRELAQVIEKFGGGEKFPGSRELAQFTRSLCGTADPLEDPDTALRDWYVFTTEMFFGLEKHLIGPVIDAELANQSTIDLERFFALATKYKNSRFSRAGATFEAHWAALLEAHGVRHDVMAKRALPDGSRPDFLFPSFAHYADPDVADGVLTFLAAKTSTKERWMQVVAEAPRIQTRHLATLDRDLNSSVLMSMLNKRVLPVIPKPIIDDCYPDTSSDEIMTVGEFLQMVKRRERSLAH